ncbi:hypothetical protein Hsw_3040 [Hymenobacter swuensis DY53]|uniref:Uncharacterized protein n=1 Tax=Hymenobacter swuensis DY53 TaxID=1227739 RepID=W8FA94_9BACT|nr:hypothetical protein Hsw_3040 [Hymenobacter swuensis DY53]
MRIQPLARISFRAAGRLGSYNLFIALGVASLSPAHKGRGKIR